MKHQIIVSQPPQETRFISHKKNCFNFLSLYQWVSASNILKIPMKIDLYLRALI